MNRPDIQATASGFELQLQQHELGWKVMPSRLQVGGTALPISCISGFLVTPWQASQVAARAGVESHVIQTLGRWHSSAHLLYIRLPRDSLASISSSSTSWGGKSCHPDVRSVAQLCLSPVSGFLVIPWQASQVGWRLTQSTDNCM